MLHQSRALPWQISRMTQRPGWLYLHGIHSISPFGSFSHFYVQPNGFLPSDYRAVAAAPTPTACRLSLIQRAENILFVFVCGFTMKNSQARNTKKNRANVLYHRWLTIHWYTCGLYVYWDNILKRAGYVYACEARCWCFHRCDARRETPLPLPLFGFSLSVSVFCHRCVLFVHNIQRKNTLLLLPPLDHFRFVNFIHRINVQHTHHPPLAATHSTASTTHTHTPINAQHGTVCINAMR